MESSPRHSPEAPRAGRRIDFAIAAVLLVIAFPAYLRTMRPTFGWGDTSELVTSAYFLAVGHSPGYPTWMLLAYPVAHLPLGHSVALRVNVWNALLGAAAISLFYFVFLGLTKRRAAAAVGALGLAFTGTFWSLTTEADVFTLHACLTALILLAALRWRRQPTDRAWCLTALLIGVGLTNHPLTALLVPALALWVWAEQGRSYFTLRRVALACGCGLLALPLYLYLPIRGLANPPPHLYHPQSLVEVWAQMTAPGARERMFDSGVSVVGERMGYFFWHMHREFGWPAFLLGFAGIVLLCVRDRRLLLLLGAIAATDLVYASNFSVYDQYMYFLPMQIAWAAFVAVGAAGALTLVGEMTARAAREALSPARRYGPATVLLLAAPALGFAANLGIVDRSGDRDPEEFAHAVLQQMPHDAAILGDWWMVAPVVYLRHVERERTDLDVFPAASIPSDRKFLDYATPEFFQRYPAVYFVEEVTHREELLRKAGCYLVPEGPVKRVYLRRPEAREVLADVPARPLARFGEEVGLAKVDVQTGSVQPWRSFDVTLYWTPLDGYRGEPREVLLMLRREESPGIWFESEPLGHDLYALDTLRPGQVLRERHRICLRTEEPPGEYDLLVRLRRPHQAGEQTLALACDHPVSATLPTTYRVARLRVGISQEPDS